MRLVSRIVALYLAAVWLPATICCGMEAVGWDVLCTPTHCCDHDDAPVEPVRAACNAIEAGDFDSAAPVLKVTRPSAVADVEAVAVAVLELNALRDRPGPRPEPPKRPRSWLPRWQFDRRAAAPAHAPDPLLG